MFRALVGGSSFALFAALVAGGGCKRAAVDATAAPAAKEADPIAALRTFEDDRRRRAAFIEANVGDRALGPDPYDIAALRDGGLVGILRGADALVLLDRHLHELARAETPPAPSAVAVYDGAPAGALRTGDILVASELAPLLAHYRPGGATLERLADVPLGDARGARAIATGPDGVVHVVDEHDSRLLTLRFSAAGVDRRAQALDVGPLRLARAPRALVVSSLLAHTIAVYPVNGALVGSPARVTNDGPFWAIAATEVTSEGDAIVVATGVENAPLDRRGGFFGNVDSFVYVFRWRARSGELARVAAINAGEHGLIVPKAVAFERRRTRGAPLGALVTSYGSPRTLRLEWTYGVERAPIATADDGIPGVSAIVATAGGFAAANPLLDAWIAIGLPEADRTEVGARPAAAYDVVPTAEGRGGAKRRDDRERLGEALFFTGLMAPTSSSEGAKSRFTCETCHFEGYVDGRTHHTGRGDIRATTKPLVGLFNNRPHFSRALDPDLSAVAENEFRVAGAPSAADPHFDVDVKEIPWLAHLGLERTHFDATELRLSLMSFLMTFAHRTNPRTGAQRTYSSLERSGARAFADRCEGCHEARSATDDEASRVPEGRWEALIFAGGPLVWARDGYERTGVVPYVHERGTRVPSLRRLYKKRPYFTNGTGSDLRAVLERVRWSKTGFSHAGSTEGEALDAPTIDALAAFLDLL